MRSTDTSSRRPAAGSLVLAGSAIALSLAALVATEWNIDADGRVDFRIYYRALSSMSGGRLYDYGTSGLNFLYPPFAAIVLRPMTWLDEQPASRVWLFVSIALGLAAFTSALRSRPTVGRIPARFVPLASAVCLWSAPAFLTLRQGQINALVALLLCADIAVVSRGHRAGGVATGLAAALKVTPLAAVPLLFIAGYRQESRRAVGAFVAVSAVSAVGLPHETWRFWTHVLFDASAVGGASNPLNANIASLTGLAADTASVQRALWVVASLALFAVVARGVRRRTDDVVGVFTIAMTFTYLVSPLTWVHHQWFLVIAVVLWIDRATRPHEIALAGFGVVVGFDLLGLGENSMIRTILIVAFGIATVVALPRSNGSTAVEPIPADMAPAAAGVS